MTMTLSAWCAGPAGAWGIAPAFQPAPAAAPAPSAAGADPAHVRLAHARAALARGDARAALACFDDAAHLAPDLAIAHLVRSLCHLELGDEAMAAECLLDALAVPDQTGDVTLHLARMVAREGSHREAMDLLAVAFALDDRAAEAAAQDPAFAGLRDHPRFLQLVGKL
jgi:tetratricopeptide (TPR) repeat protein